MNSKLSFALVITLLSLIFYNLYAQRNLDVESGIVFSGYNDVQIPRSTGTRISLSQELKTDPTIFYRLRLTYTLNKKHTLSALYAPLKLHGSRQINRPVIFENVPFPANTSLKSTYIFNSYRLTYRYDFIQTDKVQFGLGITGKIRDALIKLESNDTTSEKTNIGFVPLINCNLQLLFTNAFSLLLNADALAAPQGRAEDVLLAFQYQPDKNLGLRLGYRILEGGANVESVYNFTLLNYIIFGATLKL